MGNGMGADDGYDCAAHIVSNAALRASLCGSCANIPTGIPRSPFVVLVRARHRHPLSPCQVHICKYHTLHLSYVNLTSVAPCAPHALTHALFPAWLEAEQGSGHWHGSGFSLWLWALFNPQRPPIAVPNSAHSPIRASDSLQHENYRPAPTRAREAWLFPEGRYDLTPCAAGAGKGAWLATGSLLPDGGLDRLI